MPCYKLLFDCVKITVVLRVLSLLNQVADVKPRNAICKHTFSESTTEYKNKIL